MVLNFLRLSVQSMSELDLIMLTYTSEEANDMLEEHYYSGMRNSHQSARDYFCITGRFYRVPPVPTYSMQRFPEGEVYSASRMEWGVLRKIWSQWGNRTGHLLAMFEAYKENRFSRAYLHRTN